MCRTGPVTVTGPHRPGRQHEPGPARVDLVITPTALHPARRLSHELGVELYFKRDDLTGAGLGGNKLRGLEYLVADALAQGCDSLVTGAGPQSNWTMLAALACLRYRIEPHIVCYGTAPARAEGNLRLHRWLGTRVRFTGSAERSSVDAGIEALSAELRAVGRRPYPVPRGGATPLGAFGYLRAGQELATQLAGLDRPPAGVWLATGSGGTQAGLLAGLALTGPAYHVVGVTVSRRPPNAAAGWATWPPRPPRWPAGTRNSPSQTSGTAGSARATASRRPPGRPRPGWSR